MTDTEQEKFIQSILEKIHKSPFMEMIEYVPNISTAVLGSQKVKYQNIHNAPVSRIVAVPEYEDEQILIFICRPSLKFFEVASLKMPSAAVVLLASKSHGLDDAIFAVNYGKVGLVMKPASTLESEDYQSDEELLESVSKTFDIYSIQKMLPHYVYGIFHSLGY